MKLAAIDLGTNSVRLLVAEPDPKGGLHRVERRVTVVGFGRGVDATGRISEGALERTLPVLAEYRRIMDSCSVVRARAVATSASRDASNRSEVFDRVEEILGVRPEVIEGEAEAMLSFRGAVSSLADRPPPYLVVDVGGGSTEFVEGDETPARAVSVDVGSVRITERLLPDRPASEQQVREANRWAESMFDQVELIKAPATFIGVAGTFTSLAAIDLGLESYDPDAVHGSRLEPGRLGELIRWLASLTVEETAAISSLDPARAPVLLGGAVVAGAAIRRAGVDQVVVSEHDLLDGVAAELADRV